MKTIPELKTRIQEVSKQAIQFSRKASEVCLSDRQQARQQAREASKRTQILIQELKRQEV
jgi:hypothetical protein